MTIIVRSDAHNCPIVKATFCNGVVENGSGVTNNIRAMAFAQNYKIKSDRREHKGRRYCLGDINLPIAMILRKG